MKIINALTFVFVFSLIAPQLSAQNDDAELGKKYFEMGEFFRWGHGPTGKKSFKKAVKCF